MCGRYLLFDDKDEEEIHRIIEEANRRSTGGDLKMGMVYPTDAAPILVKLQDGHVAKAMRWGFPKWDGKGVVINARAETASTKAMFAKSLQARRVVVPTIGFYEWRHEGKAKKEMYLFREHKKNALYLAGIYNIFTLPDGSREERFTILTTNANGSIEPYHDRMPVLLDESERDAWIDDAGATDDILHRIPADLDAEHIEQEDVKKEGPEQTSLF